MKQRGFTLLEMMVSMAIMATLAGVATISYGAFREKAERVACTGNLRVLHGAFSAYIEDVGHWPQLPESVGDGFQFYDWIVESVKPYGGERVAWMCPTEERIRLLDSSRKEFMGSYSPTLFDAVPTRPYEWPMQPWLIERADNHDSGQLYVLPDASVHSLEDLMKGL